MTENKKAAQVASTCTASKASILGADYTPAMPTPGTQPARLLAELQKGGSIGPMTAWKQLGIYRAADAVLKLRRAGWNVVTRMTAVKNRYGETCHVASYSLQKREGGKV